MTRQLITILVTTGLFCCCSTNNRTIYIKGADNVDGLTTKATVTLNGLIIGQVDKIWFDRGNEILIKLKLDKEPQLPKDTEFTIENQDLIGTKGISVTSGTDNQMLTDGDTVNVTAVKKSIFPTNSLSSKLGELLDQNPLLKQVDSILIELRRLNNNLERLEEENKKNVR